MQSKLPHKGSAEAHCPRRVVQYYGAPEEQGRRKGPNRAVQSTVPKKGSAEYKSTEGKAVKAKNGSPKAQCPKSDSAYHTPRGVVQSKMPQKGSADYRSPEGQCRAQCLKGSAEA